VLDNGIVIGMVDVLKLTYVTLEQVNDERLPYIDLLLMHIIFLYIDERYGRKRRW
jgi:hypothetical protein